MHKIENNRKGAKRFILIYSFNFASYINLNTDIKNALCSSTYNYCCKIKEVRKKTMAPKNQNIFMCQIIE